MVLGAPLASVTEPDEIINECRRRNFDGLILDFEGGDRQSLSNYAAQVAELCGQHNIIVVTEKKYQVGEALTVVSSGVVSGSLKQKIARRGNNAVLEIVRLSQDIPLPAPQGRGITMSRERLDALLNSRKPATFFSSELLARYFTFKDDGDITHFIIYDDAESISKKLRLASGFGLPYAVMLYSEMKDLLGQIEV